MAKDEDSVAIPITCKTCGQSVEAELPRNVFMATIQIGILLARLPEADRRAVVAAVMHEFG